LSLADEYLATAHGHGMLVALAKREASADQYYKLVATALGCLESILKNWRLQPLKEAQIRLRYVQILFEETENDLDAETALSKGIELCERNKLLAIKYTMQMLLARVLHRSNPKAALKSLLTGNLFHFHCIPARPTLFHQPVAEDRCHCQTTG
jgi:hypothetical protein